MSYRPSPDAQCVINAIKSRLDKTDKVAFDTLINNAYLQGQINASDRFLMKGDKDV